MSAFILPIEQLQDIASTLKTFELGGQAHWITKRIRDYIRANDERELAFKLYQINLDSVNYRYFEKTELLTVEYFKYGKNIERLALLKSLQSWKYQSCETPDNLQDWMFFEIEKSVNHLMYEIIADMPEYKKAKWSY